MHQPSGGEVDAITRGMAHEAHRTREVWGQFLLYFLSVCTDGVPHDGTPVEEIVTVHTSVTVLHVLLASAGVVFTVAILLFNFVFRKRK